ncbi:MAG: helix-turn-helix domain-containing protein [Acidiferrobacter sp.]
MDTLAKRLRYARERVGLSQSELARRVKIRPQAIQFIEGGHVRRPRSMVEIARALGVNAEWLLLGEGAVEVAVREPSEHYRGEPALSDEAVAIARLWMELPQSQRVAVKETLLALLKAQP